MVTIGICDDHGASCAITENGKLLYAAGEERFSRIKNDQGFPIRSLNAGLKNLGLSYKDIVNLGYPEEIVIKVIHLIKTSEFKRRQSAPGARITKSSFGRDWRYPISNYFSEYGD